MAQRESEQPNVDSSPEQISETQERLRSVGLPDQAGAAEGDRNTGVAGPDMTQSLVRPTRHTLDETPDPHDNATPLKEETANVAHMLYAVNRAREGDLL